MYDRHRGFTVIETGICLLIMATMAAMMTFNPDVAKQTAEREAERVAAYIYRQIQTADRTHRNFDIIASPGEILIRWAEAGTNPYTSLKPNAGCAYSGNFTGGESSYNTRNKQFTQGGTIEVNGADGKRHYVIIAATEGRIRLSDTAP